MISQIAMAINRREFIRKSPVITAATYELAKKLLIYQGGILLSYIVNTKVSGSYANAAPPPKKKNEVFKEYKALKQYLEDITIKEDIHRQYLKTLVTVDTLALMKTKKSERKQIADYLRKTRIAFEEYDKLNYFTQKDDKQSQSKSLGNKKFGLNSVLRKYITK